MKIYAINAGHFKLDGGAMFGVVPKSIWNKLNPADDNNLCSWAMRCLLVAEGDRLILFDNGMGDKQDARFFGHYHLHGSDTLERSLAAHGFNRDDITDVVLTHLHFDHCGGSILRNGDKLEPAFPNATYWSNEEHWQWAMQPNARERASFLKENILPIQESGRLRMVQPDPAPAGNTLRTAHFSEHISFYFVDGHTRAMMLPKIEVNGKTIVFMADLLPSVAHLPLPYVMSYDMFPFTTLDEKALFLEEAVANGYYLAFEHDPAIECCTLKLTEKGIRHDKVLSLSEVQI